MYCRVLVFCVPLVTLVRRVRCVTLRDAPARDADGTVRIVTPPPRREGRETAALGVDF